MEWNCQVNDVVYRCDVAWPLPKKGRTVSLTTSHDLNTRDIPLRQHIQSTYGNWKLFQVKHLT